MDLKAKEKRMSKERVVIHLVILYNPSSIDNAYSFIDYDDAVDFFIEKAKELYDDMPEYPTVDDVYDYMGSEAFLDKCLDVLISLDDSILQIEETTI